MKKTVLLIIGCLLVLVSLGIGGYPFISNYLNSLNASSSVVQYLDTCNDNTSQQNNHIIEAARDYNKTLLNNRSISDPFSNSDSFDTNGKYNELLNVNNSGIMAVLQIPSLELELPVYHGTSAKTLEHGIGHLPSTSLPVGGEGTHTVLTGHTGFSTFKLFSDLDKLELNDIFIIKVAGEELAYKIDNIAVVLPHETELLQIQSDKDLVTLVTCTPFGVNSHRLFVRGKRTQLSDVDLANVKTHTENSTWQNEYIQAILIGLGVMAAILLVFFIVRLIISIAKRKRKTNEA